jgi:phosphate uptake regulator
MNQHNNNIDSLNQFLDKFQTAKNYNTKELRLTINDAEQLSLGISRILVRQTSLADKVIDLQSQIIELQTQISANITLEVSQDGGKF